MVMVGDMNYYGGSLEYCLMGVSTYCHIYSFIKSRNDKRCEAE
jgi:hypothetical protein